MAIQKAIVQESGITLNYWRIRNIHVYCGGALDGSDASCLVEVEGYVDSASRQAGKKPVDFKQVQLPGAMVPLETATADARTVLYPLLVQDDAALAGGTKC